MSLLFLQGKIKKVPLKGAGQSSDIVEFKQSSSYFLAEVNNACFFS